MNKIPTLLSICLAHVLYRVSFLIPKDKKLWVCIGWHTNKDREIFADNSKYFYLYLSHHQEDVRAVWLSRDKKLATILRDKGYEAYSINTPLGCWLAIRAGVTIIDAFLEMKFWQFTGGSTVIQLWHGKGMKMTGYDSPYSLKTRSKFKQAGMFNTPNTLIASSQYTARLMASTFGIAEEKIMITGLPRDDVLQKTIEGSGIDSHTELEKIVAREKESGAKKIILYAPTFRPDGKNPIESLDLPALQKKLEDLQYCLLLSLHPKLSHRNVKIQEQYKNIIPIESSLDIYPQLRLIDMLITDYSSLYVDFLLLDRPIIFYTYDLDDYKVKMGLHEDFINLTPGPHPESQDELVNALCLEDTYQNERQRVVNTLFAYKDDNASRRIFLKLKANVL